MSSLLNKKWLKRTILIGTILFIAIQFIRPDLHNTPSGSRPNTPAQVTEILQRSCYDCHSTETKLKWFDQIAPAYWLVADHIKKGREALNFSNWDSLQPGEQKAKLWESFNQMMTGNMPLSSYTQIHTDARVSSQDLQTMKDYLTTLVPHQVADTAKINAADRQFIAWFAQQIINKSVQPTLNGINYPSEYAGWQAVTTTERFDNATMRVIYGNPVAISAIKEHKTNPWPDGAIFAKIAWSQLADSAGYTRPGEFIQAEFMIKDSKKYASTDGWGWGRWRGNNLKPYGKNAAFTTECMNCHKPMQKNDFVFTIPLDLTATAGKSFDNPLERKVITTRIDKKQQTMSVLYGNEFAVEYAKHPATVPPGSAPGTPAGHISPGSSEFSLVTWSQREDPHWFGAKIPGAILSIETLTCTEKPDHNINTSYARYTGQELQLTVNDDSTFVRKRIQEILSFRASVKL